MRFRVIELILLLSLCELIACKGYFTIVGSKLLRFKKTYHVSITAQGYDAPETLEVAIRSAKKDEKIFEVVKNVTLLNGKTQEVVFDLKDQPEADYNLEARSLSGEKFEKIVKVDMNMKEHSVFVQTDKSIYKPADKVQFRVLVLDADMKPLKKAKVQAYITDGAQNRVKQFDDVSLHKGVFQSELQLSDSPVLGSWMIHVKLNGAEATAKEFEVAEYVLPKFEVTIDANPDANYKEGKIRATVKAKYTFGKVAKGNATVTAEVEEFYHYWRGYGQAENPKVTVVKSVSVDGKTPVVFDIEDELKITDKSFEKTVKLSATFTEELTGKEQNATTTVKIHKTPHKIELTKSANKFKPGLPFKVTAIVKAHDKNAPITDSKNALIFTIKHYYDVLRTCEGREYPFGHRYSEQDSTGIIKTSYDCREELSFSDSKEALISNGFAELDIDFSSNSTRVDVTAKYLETTANINYIERAETESKQFIQAKLSTEKPKLSENVKIDVLATHDLTHLTFQVVAKGEVVVSKVVDVPKKKQHQIEFAPTLSMVPTANVVVYYITADGEIISDSLKVEFGNELRNFIDIELSTDQAKPGEKLDISIYSKPNSFVGLLGVDQSVLLLKKGNDIEQSTVFAELAKYNKIDKFNYQWSESYDYSKWNDFKKSEAVVITNAKKEYSRPHLPRIYNLPESRPMLGFRGGSSQPLAISGFSSGSSANRFAVMNSPAAFDNTIDDRMMLTNPSARQSPPSFEIRKTFPETFLFDTFDFDSSTSNATISKKVPDTITSWIITGFSVDPITGLGLTRQPSKFTVFQPFFVSTNLPYSIKRGEVVSIPIVVFNYLDSDQEAEVTFFNSEGEFEFADVKEDSSPARRRRALETQRKKKVMVKSQSGTSVPFMIRPFKVGHITIKVVATSNVAGDGVERQLIVEPEGVTQYMNKAVFIDLRSNPEFKSNISISIPPNAVPDSTKIEASAIGDILGPSIENLDKLIKLPYGCGEQNMLNFVPNIVVLDYLTALNKLTPEIESKAKKFMESGYQRELTYKHDDGSYSAFGKSDKSGSTWLTAFVAKSFNQAAKHIMVDEEIVKQALDFLSKVQTENGSFPEVGHVSHKDMQGGSSNGIALTAYTLITFLESQDSNKTYQSTIDKALNYVVQHFDTLDDNYSLAIASYALQLAKHSSKDSFAAKLETKAETKNGLMHWEKAVPKSDESNPWSYQPNSVNVEMSAYALQAFVEAGRETDAVPIMKWLVTQRNENGGFQSTQDTVVGLQALSKLATKISVPNSKIDITIKHSGGSTTKLNVNEKNSLILQKHELPPTATEFEVTAQGRGFSILQIAYRYNLNNAGDWPRFTLEPVVNKDSNKDFLHLTVCTSFVADDQADKSNMAVMEVALPSGYTFNTDTLPELKATENVKKIETKESETIVVVYFDDVGSKKLCPEIKAYRTHSVAKQKPAPVVVYDYYDNSRRARSFYNPPEVSLCDICNGAEECKQDCEQTEINIV